MSGEPVPAAAPTADHVARALRGFGPLGLLGLILVMPFSSLLGPFRAAVPLLWAWRSRTPLAELGLVRPRSWVRTIVLAILTGIAFKLAMKSVVLPLLGAPPVNAAFRALEGNAAMLPGMLLAVTLGAGLGEELAFRGFLFERLRTLLGDSRRTAMISVLFTSVIFGLAHLPEQGWPGAEQAFVFGLVVASLYASTRSLWFPIVFHAAFDIAAVFIIYRGLETRIAHWFFR